MKGKTISESKASLEFSLLTTEKLEEMLRNQIELLGQVTKKYESELTAKDVLISNQREIIIRQSLELEQMRGKN